MYVTLHCWGCVCVYSKIQENKWEVNWWYLNGIWFLRLMLWSINCDYSYTQNRTCQSGRSLFLASSADFSVCLWFCSLKKFILIHLNATSLSSASSRSVKKKVIWLCNISLLESGVPWDVWCQKYLCVLEHLVTLSWFSCTCITKTSICTRRCELRCVCFELVFDLEQP